MQSKFGGNLAQRKNAASVFFVLGFLVFAIWGVNNPTASAALGEGTDFRIGFEDQNKDSSARLNAIPSSDYTASYTQNFYSTAEKNAANTTGNWSANSGFLSLSPSASAPAAPTYTVEDRSSSLSGFTGPVSVFANNNTIPLIGSKAGSLNLPISTVSNETMLSFSDRLVDFASFNIKALGLSACGDLDTYEATAGSDGQILLGNEQAYVYFLVAGDNADKNAGTKAVKMNKLRLVSLSADGKISTQTEDVSSGLTALGFEAITDVSCSNTECIIAGTKGKLARYDGKIYTDLSGKLGSTASNLALAINEDGYFLIAGSEYSSASGRYIGKIYKYQSGNITKISEDSFFVSTAAGTFGMAFDHYSDECLIVRGAENVAAYVYADGKFEDVSSKINKYYTSGVMSPVIYGGPSAWFIIDKGTTGSIVRFDGESAIDIRDSLDINIPVFVIGSNGSGSAILLGGGTASSPKLYKVTESSFYASTSYQSTGVVESIKVNKTTGTITSAYLLASDYIPTGTSLKYYLSADGGVHWEEAIIGANDTSSRVTFQNPGNDLRWKVSMATTDIKRSPSVYGLHIYYTEGSSLTTTLQNGELVRASNGSKVYIVMNGKKRWIASAAEFSKMGYSWAKVKIVSSDVLDNMAEIKLIKAKGGSSIFYITGSGMKKLVLNDAVFKSYGNKYEDVVEIDQAVIDSYPTVRFIRGADGKVYQITGAVKKWITSPEEFKKLGGNWSEIAAVNDTELAAYTTEGSIGISNIVDGDLLRAFGSPDVYIVKIVGNKRFRRLILAPAVFNSYKHLKWENIKNVDSPVLNQFILSELVSDCSKAKADVDCDIYLLQPNNALDSGWKLILPREDFINGKYDIDAVYVVNNTDFRFYGDKLSRNFETTELPVIQTQVFMNMLAILEGRYGNDFKFNASSLRSIFAKLIIREKNLPVTALRADFQIFLNEINVSERAEKTARLKYFMTTLPVYEKYLLADILDSFDNDKTMKSAERMALENKIITSYPGLKADFAMIDALIPYVIGGSVRYDGTGKYYSFSRTDVKNALDSFDNNLSLRIEQLF